MPELPEVETVMRGMEREIRGKVIARVKVGRRDLRGTVPENFSTALEGQRIVALTRRGKYIIVILESGKGFALHLGMSGRVRFFPTGKRYVPEKHDHIIWETAEGPRVVFNDPRRFGGAFLLGRESWRSAQPFESMGPEPLEKAFGPEALYKALRKRRGPVKSALLDQRMVAGIGNIYACEALYESGVSPARACDRITSREAARLALAIKNVLKRAIAAGGSTLKDYRNAEGGLGYFQHQFAVYGKEGEVCAAGCACAKKGGIKKVTLGGRSTYYCPARQK